MPFFKGSSRPGDRTWVSWITARFLTIWTMIKTKTWSILKTIRKASEERWCVQWHLKDERDIVLEEKEQEDTERCPQVNILEIGKNLTNVKKWEGGSQWSWTWYRSHITGERCDLLWYEGERTERNINLYTIPDKWVHSSLNFCNIKALLCPFSCTKHRAGCHKETQIQMTWLLSIIFFNCEI